MLEPALAPPVPHPPRALVAMALAAAALAFAAGGLALAGTWLGAAAPAAPASPFGVGFGEAAPAAGGVAGLVLAAQAAFHAKLISALSAGPGETVALVLASLAYGVFHAAGPGHGKAVVSAYILATGQDLRRGLAASTAAAFLQAGVALALVLGLSEVLGVGAEGFRTFAHSVDAASFALVALVGAWLLARKSLALADRLAPGVHACGPNCGHVHAPPPAGRKAFAGTVLAAGLRPCSGAVLVMVYALARGIPWTGVASVLAMAAGTAATTGAVAALSVHAKGLALRLASGRGAGGALALACGEALAGGAMLALGLAMLWATGMPGAPPGG